MTDIVSRTQRPRPTLLTQLQTRRNSLVALFRRYRRAFGYVHHRLNPSDAQAMVVELQSPADMHILAYFTAEAVIRSLTATYVPPNNIVELAHRAATFVRQKWSDTGETQDIAIDWAIQKILQWSAEDGLPLAELTGLIAGNTLIDTIEREQLIPKIFN